MIGSRPVGRMALCGLLALCGGPALAPGAVRAEEGNVFTNLFKYGGTTVPPSQPKELEEAYCPTVEVPDGGSAITTPGGNGVRTQVTLGRLARECTRRQDGSIAVKVGVEARVLLGPSGAPGRFDVPFTIAIRQDSKVVTSRVRHVPVTVAPGEAQGFATIVEDDLIVPAAIGADYEISVGLGGAGKAAKPKPRRKPTVAAGQPAADPGAAQ